MSIFFFFFSFFFCVGALRTTPDGHPIRDAEQLCEDRFFTFVLTDGAGASYYGETLYIYMAPHVII